QQVNHVVGSVLQTAQQVNQFVHSALETAQTAHTTLRQAVIDQLFTGFGRQNLPQSLGQVPGRSLPQNLLQNLPRGQGTQGSTFTTTQQDAEFVKEQATKLVQDKVCHPFRDSSHLKVERSYVSMVTANEIHVDFKMKYDAVEAWTQYGSIKKPVDGMITLSFR